MLKSSGGPERLCSALTGLSGVGRGLSTASRWPPGPGFPVRSLGFLCRPSGGLSRRLAAGGRPGRTEPREPALPGPAAARTRRAVETWLVFSPVLWVSGWGLLQSGR